MLRRGLRKCIARGLPFIFAPPGESVGLDWIASSCGLVVPFLSSAMSVNRRSNWQVTLAGAGECVFPISLSFPARPSHALCPLMHSTTHSTTLFLTYLWKVRSWKRPQVGHSDPPYHRRAERVFYCWRTTALRLLG